MAENSAISWTDHTFNPWIGCTRISPACDGCYAEALMGGQGRFARAEWGAPGKGDGTRSRTKDWSKPRKWNREAEKADLHAMMHGEPEPKPVFVFCASLADVFDNAVPAEWRRDLFELIRATPNLTWLLLTKRPQNIVRLFMQAFEFSHQERQEGLHAHFPRNIILGTTIEDRKRLAANASTLRLAALELRVDTFWSCEPLLEDLGKLPELPSWVIVGGETDQGRHEARPADPAWFRSIRDQCAVAGVPFHFKQWGEWQPVIDPPGNALGRNFSGGFVQRLGKDRDPCTLDGVTHNARPNVAAA